MEKVHVKDRDIVIPGELLAEGMTHLPSGKAIREKEKIFATSVGLISLKGRVIKVIPLSGKYIPERQDTVIGQITGISKFGWRVDIGCPFEVELNIGEASYSYIDTQKNSLSDFFDVGDYIVAGILEINENRFIKVTAKGRQYRRLKGGIVVDTSPSKVPRIIGTQGSMIRMLQDESGCEIIVGQNGRIWINGEPENVVKVRAAIDLITNESHKAGLTEIIKKLLGGKK